MLKTIVVCLAVFLLIPDSLGVSQKVHKPTANYFSGDWELDPKSERRIGEPITLVISQHGPEIRILEKLTRSGTSRELKYYIDSRGETNPAGDGKRMLNSVTKLKDRKLIIRFELPSSRSGNTPISNERVDEWRLSRDGQTLTQTSTFKRSAQPDASVNPHSSPRASTSLTPSLTWQEKKIYKRVP